MRDQRLKKKRKVQFNRFHVSMKQLKLGRISFSVPPSHFQFSVSPVVPTVPAKLKEEEEEKEVVEGGEPR